MKLKALIVDDEYPARRELRYLLEQFENVEVVGEATNAREALKLIAALDYSIIFLDVQMPGMNGIEMGEILASSPNHPFIVFISAFEEYALRAFEVDAADYILKPIDEKRLYHAMQKIFKISEQRNSFLPANHEFASAGPREELRKFERLPVEKQGKTLLISPDEIIYAYTQEDNVYIKTLQERYATRFTLKDLQIRLDEKNFFRTHRCYIVNLSKVREIIPFFNGTYTLVVDDDKKSEVPVSRNQAKKLKKILGM